VGISSKLATPVLDDVREHLDAWAKELGFDALGVADAELTQPEQRLQVWLDAGHHGEMTWMQAHGRKRSHPEKLVPGTVRVITVRMNYLSTPPGEALSTLADPNRAYIARYALGRDYHKLIRKRLQRLASRLEESVGPIGYRVFCDSAPVLEKPLAAKAGLGWMGKHSLVLDRHAGSWFFLGEIYTDLPLPVDNVTSAHCGSCRRCIDICPTRAIVAPYQLDARRCIAYLTIEHTGPIPESLRPLIGNRIFGCDDCQLVCPWNRHAKRSREAAFLPREALRAPQLVDLFAWNEQRFLSATAGNPLRRVGYTGFLRNVAVALGNAPRSAYVRSALEKRCEHPSNLVREHIHWALNRQASNG
jgi:epoxyqueuosine reductase